jgi:hypothetical protein
MYVLCVFSRLQNLSEQKTVYAETFYITECLMRRGGFDRKSFLCMQPAIIIWGRVPERLEFVQDIS